VLSHDPHGSVQSEARTFADFLDCKERLEDVGWISGNRSREKRKTRNQVDINRKVSGWRITCLTTTISVMRVTRPTLKRQEKP
jgi:hypothetical protein